MRVYDKKKQKIIVAGMKGAVGLMRFNLRIILTAIMLIFTAMLQGCSFAGISDENLLQPPRATGVKADIQNLLETTTKGDYKLKYPQNGENRSAIIMCSEEGSEQNEAIAFYTTGKDTSVNLAFMNESGGKWSVVSVVTNQNSEVDRVYLDDVDNDKKNEIIVGWVSYVSSNNQIIMYDYTGETITPTIISGDNTAYSDMVLTDITDDGVTDLLVLNSYMAADGNQSERGQSTILYSACVNGTFSKVSEISMSSSVVSVAKLTVGNIEGNVKALFVDGVTQNSADELVTQVIYYSKSDQILKNPLNVNDASGESQNITLRKTSTVCKDVDNDGIIEVPSTYLHEVKNGEIPSAPIIRWYKVMADEDVREVMQTFSNYFDAFYFVLPESWEDRVVVSGNNTSRTTMFYEIIGTDITTSDYEKSTETATEQRVESATIPEIDDSEKREQRETVLVNSEPLLTIRVFTQKVWKNEGAARLSEGYTVIRNENGLVYTFKKGSSDDDKMNITSRQINRSFHIIK